MRVSTVTKKREPISVMDGVLVCGLDKQADNSFHLVLNAVPGKGDNSFKRQIILNRQELIA